MKSAIRFALVVAAMLAIQQLALGSSIITMPTADIVPTGKANVATYAVNFDGTTPAGDTTMDVHIIYAGVAKNLEVEANVYDMNSSGIKQDFFVITYKLLDETLTRPQISIGVKNPNGETLGANDDPTYFIAGVKTLNPPAPGETFKPIFRLHAGLGDNYHEGLFGGAQALVTPKIGLIAVHDANDPLYAVMFKMSNNSPTLKAGTLGDHSWLGVDYDLRF